MLETIAVNLFTQYKKTKSLKENGTSGPPLPNLHEFNPLANAIKDGLKFLEK